jgi:hypothetical protein
VVGNGNGIGWLSIPLLMWPTHQSQAAASVRTPSKPIAADIKLHMETVVCTVT